MGLTDLSAPPPWIGQLMLIYSLRLRAQNGLISWVAMSDSSQPSTQASAYARRVVADKLPRIPLKVSLDLTYRCNNCCLHCWLWTADTPEERAAELTTDEWRTVIDQSRALGTREWAISGGEPLLREDFTEIFEYATSKATHYSLNTNGTLITPQTAQLLKRKGNKMVAVYGATAEVYDHVTRNPGGFEALLQGLNYLKEAGVGFTVQLIPMRDNWHQWDDMQAFAKSWSKHWRVGAPWLFKTACGDPERNAEIERQRLDPADVVKIDPPNTTHGQRTPGDRGEGTEVSLESAAIPACSEAGPWSGQGAVFPYARCIDTRRDFHVDPYGGMSFCCFVKDPLLRHDLRTGASALAASSVLRGISLGAVASAWEHFIPSVADIPLSSDLMEANCFICEQRCDCRWCDAYGFLEHGFHGAKIDYLCGLARENRAFRKDWLECHRRYYEIAGITIQVDSDLPFRTETFDRKFECFRVPSPGLDTVTLRHHYELPDTRGYTEGREIYRRPPWAIYEKGKSWVYVGISPEQGDDSVRQVAVFSAEHDCGEIHNDPAYARAWREGGLESLTLFPSDQILIARLVADRRGCLLHSGALTLDGKGLLFVGHSEAGKSTTMMLMRREFGDRVEILCDDRNVVRHWPKGMGGGTPGFYVHGTWSHGDVTDVSSGSAPLHAVLFLQQDSHNSLVALRDPSAVWRSLLATLIHPLVTADWWAKQLDVLERLVGEMPCYTMHFDKSGAITSHLEGLVR